MANIHPTSILIDCSFEDDISIGPFCYLDHVHLGHNVVIEGNSRITQSSIDDNTEILWWAIIRESTIGKKCILGCEVKRSTLGDHIKAKHLGTLIGSATVWHGTNFGGGSKCANYDGNGKWTFILGENIFIGCDVILSVKSGTIRTIGSGSKIGANVHVDVDIPPYSLVYTDRNNGTTTLRAWYYTPVWNK